MVAMTKRLPTVDVDTESKALLSVLRKQYGVSYSRIVRILLAGWAHLSHEQRRQAMSGLIELPPADELVE